MPTFTFEKEWLGLAEFKHWLEEKNQDGYCRVCEKQIAIKYASSWALKAHAKTSKHKGNLLKHRFSMKSEDDDSNKMKRKIDSLTDVPAPSDSSSDDAGPSDSLNGNKKRRSQDSKADKRTASSDESDENAETQEPTSDDSRDPNDASAEEKNPTISTDLSDSKSSPNPPKKTKKDSTSKKYSLSLQEGNTTYKERMKILKQTRASNTANTSHDDSEEDFFQEIKSTVHTWPSQLQLQAKHNICNVVFDLAQQTLGET